MHPFKFFQKPFNTEDYDITDFRFLGVTPIFTDENGRSSRNMIFVFTDGTIVPAQIIHDEHDAFHRADIFEVRGNQVFQIARQSNKYINVSFTFTPNAEL